MKLARTRLGMALATAAIAITASITAVASPAYAAEDVGEGGHCVATTQGTNVKCFATYDEAEAYVSSIAEILPDKRSDGGTLGFQSGARNAGTQLFGWRLIFIGFDWAFYAPFGGSFWVITNGPACTGPTSNIDYQVANLVVSLGPRWNDDISSYLDFSNCWTKLYEHINFGGRSRGYTPDSPVLGDFNNITSSIRWS